MFDQIELSYTTDKSQVMSHLEYIEWKHCIQEQKEKAAWLKEQFETFLQEVDLSEEEDYEAEKVYAVLCAMATIYPTWAIQMLNEYDYYELNRLVGSVNTQMDMIVSIISN